MCASLKQGHEAPVAADGSFHSVLVLGTHADPSTEGGAGLSPFDKAVADCPVEEGTLVPEIPCPAFAGGTGRLFPLFAKR
jgi:hypothetical protein